MTTYQHLIVETRGHVGIVRLNRPEARNALNAALLRELGRALAAFDEQAEVGAIVICGDEKAFAAGADIREMADRSSIEMLTSGHIDLFDELVRIRKPIIAAVSGWCLGGGNELAMGCDMIVASESARFGQPEISIGVIPGAGGTQRLTRAVGKALAMEMVLNARTLTAEEALRFGLVNRVTPVATYLEEAVKLAEELAARAPLAVRLGKEAVNHAHESFLREGLVHERRSFYLLFGSEDQKEGMQAFLGKRAAQWKGH
jgi:enoyl-CoA hydratase